MSENKEGQVEKDGKIEVEKVKDTLRKPMTGSKRTCKTKPTVPKPFSLATDKRMTRERFGHSEQPKQTVVLPNKSTSLNLKPGTQFLTRSMDLKAKARGMEVGTRKSPIITKDGEKTEMTKLNINSTSFRALPLPSFYTKKDGTRPKPEIKKVPLTRPKSSELDRRSKFVSEHCMNDKAETKGKSVPKIISTNAKPVTVKKLVKVS
ncbi:hypothetical protein Sjap_013871 [Stephania japonica]|uniref:Uncharacterized protein n=1 Tax=Stephania japonica TaxID=461633 RepID=A0AAP0NZG1_9MAGN